MKDARQTTLGPMKRKTFHAVLARFLEEECPQIGGELTRRVLSRRIEELFDEFYPHTSRMKMGQLMWNAVDEKEIAGYGKSIEKIKLRPVCIDLVETGDIEDRLEGKSKKVVRKQQAKRIFEQAKQQQGVLTYTDVGEMMGLSSSTIGKYVREMEQEDGYRVPHRGLLHDIGPTVTHKRSICYKYLIEGKSVEQVSRETNHSPEAITKYITDYKRIHTCLTNDLSIDDVAYCTGKSRRLVEEYAGLIEKHEVSITKRLNEK